MKRVIDFNVCPRFKADGHGDVHVKIKVVLPDRLSDEAKDAARRFLDLTDQPDPRPNEA